MAAHHFREPSADALGKIKAILGPGGWKDPSEAPAYFDDPRGRFTGMGALIALPRDTDTVARLTRLCNDEGLGIVPYSGGTGVVAGQLSIDSPNAIIMSFERMDRIRALRLDDDAIVVEAGCILETIHQAALAHGRIFPLNMASKGSCRIGGNLATNAGGIQVLRHGNARDLCLGIEAVLADGSILDELRPLHKNNTGYDLRHLLIGSEGTLGLITAASLRLKPLPPQSGTAFLAIDTPAQGLKVHQMLKTHLGETISALELMSGFGLALVTEKFPELSNPFAGKPPWALLLEAAGPEGIHTRIEAGLQACFEAGLLSDGVIAQSQAQQDALWRLRENTPDANRAEGAFCNSDTAVPVSKVPAFIADTDRAVRAVHPGLRLNSYGHLGDGNIHHNVFGPKGTRKTDFLSVHPGIIDAVRHAINDVTHAHDGSISAEHGIGRLKAADLDRYVSPARREALRRIKRALDPKNTLNPGALLR